jgi:hypothetical protein
MTEGLLLLGVATALTFYAVMAIEGARRPGYDWTYHTGSELEIGEGGWLMRASFVLMAVGMVAYAAGIHRALDTRVGAALVGVFAVGNLLEGVFIPDPVRGFPAGAPTLPPPRPLSRPARVHDVVAPVMFVALLGACLAVATRVDGWLVVYSVATAVGGLALMVSTALSYARDAPRTGVVQRGFLAVAYLWIVVVGLDLAL